MKDQGRLALETSLGARAILASRLADVLVDAAVEGQGMHGRGALCVTSDEGSLVWTYKPLAACAEEISE